MPHRQRVEETSRKRGRPLSLEVIEELLGFAGPGAIKRIAGVKDLFVGLTKSTGAKGRFPARRNLEEALEGMNRLATRIRGSANVSRPRSTVGGKLRENVGGQRPPLGELEELALRRQEVRRSAGVTKRIRGEALKKRTGIAETNPAKIKRINAVELEIKNLIGPKGIDIDDLPKLERLLAKLRELGE